MEYKQVSEEEDGEEYNPQNDASSSDEETSQAEQETLSVNGKMTWSLKPHDSQDGSTKCLKDDFRSHKMLFPTVRTSPQHFT